MFLTITKNHKNKGTLTNSDILTAFQTATGNSSLTLSDLAGWNLGAMTVNVNAAKNTSLTSTTVVNDPDLFAATVTDGDQTGEQSANLSTKINNQQFSGNYVVKYDDSTTANHKLFEITSSTTAKYIATPADDTQTPPVAEVQADAANGFTFTFGITLAPTYLTGTYSAVVDRTALGTSGRSNPSDASDPTTAAEEWANERAKARNRMAKDPEDYLKCSRFKVAGASYTDPLTNQTIGPEVLETKAWKTGMPLASMSNPTITLSKTGFDSYQTYMAERLGGNTAYSFAQKVTPGLFRTSVGIQPGQAAVSAETMGFRHDINDVSGWDRIRTEGTLNTAQGAAVSEVISDHQTLPSSQS